MIYTPSIVKLKGHDVKTRIAENVTYTPVKMLQQAKQIRADLLCPVILFKKRRRRKEKKMISVLER